MVGRVQGEREDERTGNANGRKPGSQIGQRLGVQAGFALAIVQQVSGQGQQCREDNQCGEVPGQSRAKDRYGRPCGGQ
ncbi:hypothetical protein NHF46_18440 [Arthrobacter alpinus]|nr:hypothetical protein [Arthrobacter alpinus]